MDARLNLSPTACSLALSLIALGLGGCARLGYYSELARGQYQLLAAREPIEQIIRDEQQDEGLQRRLSRVLDARRFAVEELQLPDNGSYTQYADLKRDHVLWNVLATPEFSLEPVTDCFPIAGCVAYRGHYRESEARKQAERFRARGLDVLVGGVPAYSTLGWFDDPVLNTMMHWRDADLLGTVFHELAHQRLYVRDDSAFNESFASFVERRGLQAYFGSAEDGIDLHDERRRDFVGLVLQLRSELEALYQQDLDPHAMRLQKQLKFSELRER